MRTTIRLLPGRVTGALLLLVALHGLAEPARAQTEPPEAAGAPEAPSDGAHERPDAARVKLALYVIGSRPGVSDWGHAMNELSARAASRGLPQRDDNADDIGLGGALVVPVRGGPWSVELTAEHRSARRGFTVREAMGGWFGEWEADYAETAELDATLVTAGVRYGRRGGSYRPFVSAAAGFARHQVEMMTPGGDASGSAIGPAGTAGLGLEMSRGLLRTVLIAGYQISRAEPEYRTRYTSGNSGFGSNTGRMLFTSEQDLRDFVAGRKVDFDGPFLRAGVILAL